MGEHEARCEALRAEFPVLARLSYLNTGSQGPVPARAERAAADRVSREIERGRGTLEHFAGLGELGGKLRGRLARLLGATPDEVALTHSTTDGVNTVLGGLSLGRGDEVLTSDEEHPGLLAPLAAGRERRGFTVRSVPFAELAGEVSPATRLVACSHVSWISGRVVDAAGLRDAGAPLLLDGAQGLGAVPVDVADLGCDFYAASGQKWLCGPDGSGSLFVRRERLPELPPSRPGHDSLADPSRPLEAVYVAGAARFDTGVLPGAGAAWSLAALEVLGEAGWDWVHARAARLALRLSERLADRGLEVAERGPTTLVSWRDPDPEAAVERLATAGILVRHLPGGHGLVRASVGAWTHEDEIERLTALAAA